MKKSRLLYIGVLFVFIVSCKKKETSPPPTTNQYIWPLAVGNTWHYNIIKFDSTEDGHPVDTDSYTLTVNKDTIIASETWFELNDSLILINRADGTHIYNGGDRLYIKYPDAFDDTFQSDFDTLLLLWGHLIVQTPAGQFSNCYHYADITAGEWPNGGDLLYFSPGVGLVVKEEYYFGDLTARIELVSYVLY